MYISFGDFKKLDIRIGRILNAERIEGSNKLIKLEIGLGAEKRQIIAGIAQFFEPNFLIGKEVPIATNLEPRSFLGFESQGMMLAADVAGEPVLLSPHKDVPPGSEVK